jgi:hypothetical protein
MLAEYLALKSEGKKPMKQLGLRFCSRHAGKIMRLNSRTAANYAPCSVEGCSDRVKRHRSQERMVSRGDGAIDRYLS